MGTSPRYVTSHPGQLSLLTSVGLEKKYWPKCGYTLRLGVKAEGWLIPFVDKRAGGR